MTVNGLTLPSSFGRFISRPDAAMTSWLPKDNRDAYGNEWRTFPMEVFTDAEMMRERTAWLPGNERLANETGEEVAARNAASADLPGSIPWITDFSRIVQFGNNDTGEAYCFDYRDDPQKPSVIFIDEWYWRRVAPDFDTLLDILEPYDSSIDLDDRDEEIERRLNPDNEPDEGGLPGIINGLVLPAAFQAFLQHYPDRVWRLKGVPNVDESQEWQFVPYDTLQLILSGTGYAAAKGKGITDSSRILAFGVSPGRSPFAFDYRENPQEPSVICMSGPDNHWRRIAPNFETFLHLLEGYGVMRAEPASETGPVAVNGLLLPASFQAFITKYPARVWDLKESFRQPLRVQFQPYPTAEQMAGAAAQWAESFRRLSDVFGADRQSDRPGYLPVITDYSQIVPFGYCRRGLPFSFDFREDLQEPSIIHLPDFGFHWRRIAPNFEAFTRLLEGYPE